MNQVFTGHSLQGASWLVMTKMNYVLLRQLMSERRRERLGLEASDFFFGLINKANYRFELGRVRLEPRWKSEYLNQSRDLFSLDSRTTLMELFSGLAEIKLLQTTKVQAGLEYVLFNDFDEDLEDFNSLTVGFQFTNESNYQGYVIRAVSGAVVERKNPKGVKSSTTTQSFITVYAGLK